MSFKCSVWCVGATLFACARWLGQINRSQGRLLFLFSHSFLSLCVNVGGGVQFVFICVFKSITVRMEISYLVTVETLVDKMEAVVNVDHSDAIWRDNILSTKALCCVRLIRIIMCGSVKSVEIIKALFADAKSSTARLHLLPIWIINWVFKSAAVLAEYQPSGLCGFMSLPESTLIMWLEFALCKM